MRDLPGGEVTFCFTDIEGSTRLARRLGERWLGVLQQHNHILREVWAEHDGVEVMTEGDAFFVVFRDPAAAVVAAIDAHARLAGAAWPEDGAVRVRIGLHTGVADVADDDYVGVEVHKAARVAAAAHGAQVLVSGRTRDLAAAALPATIHLRSLGAFALKDFEDGVELVRVEHETLAPGPAPKALPVAAHNLPLLRTPFFGRDVERIEVAKLSEQPGVTTVVGPGGAGKTRLVFEVGRAVSADRPHGVWAVLLAGEPADGDVTPAVARALGIPDAAGVALVDAVAEALRDRDALLVLDNCEHVLDSAARVIDQLQQSCPALSILVTSRQPLGLPGERVWAMPSLSVPPAGATAADVLASDAGQLFVDRAGAANPAFALTDATAPAVAMICRGVDGLPLAVELAAAATRSVPLDALARRVEAGTMPLRSTGAAAAPRQRSVDELISWSYDMLDETQAAVFRRLAVFRGGWTLEAAEAVCADDAIDATDVVIALGDLVDRSLVVLEVDGRYRMLVLIRAFAEQRLQASGEADDVGARHRAYFTEATLALRAQGAGAASFAAVDADLDNFRAAFDRAIAAGDATNAHTLSFFVTLLVARGHHRDADATVARLQAAAPPESDIFVSALTMRAHFAAAFGDPEEACELAAAALRGAERLGDSDFAITCAGLLAWHQANNGDVEGSLATVDRFLTDDVTGPARARLLEARGGALFALGRTAEAAACHLEAADLAALDGDELAAVETRLMTIETLYDAQRRSEALGFVRAAIDFADAADAAAVRCHAIFYATRLGWCAAEDPAFLADLRKIVDVPAALEEALAVADSIGDSAFAVVCRVERVTGYIFTGDFGAATEELRWVFSHRNLTPQRGLMTSLVELAAIVLDARGDPLASALAHTSLADDNSPWLRDRLVAIAQPGDAPLDLAAAVDLAADRLQMNFSG